MFSFLRSRHSNFIDYSKTTKHPNRALFKRVRNGAFTRTDFKISPHFIKLDKKIVKDIHQNANKQQIVKSIVSLAMGIDSKLVAEGVEAWQELEILFRFGFRYAQGYLFSLPVENPPMDLGDAVPDRGFA